MKPVSLWWVGASAEDGALLDGVRRRLGREFGAEVVTVSSPERPEGSWDPRRRQHSSTRILAWLACRVPAGCGRILGLTDADLFIPILTFVFGEAQMNGRAALVSTARLGALDGELAAERGRFALRVEKECVHELGHTYGLIHCRSPRCAMSRSSSLLDVDAKGSGLCPDCRSFCREQGAENGDRDEQEEYSHPDRR